MRRDLFRQRPMNMLHRALARLHGGMPDDPPSNAAGGERSEGFRAAYAEYASATAHANAMLQEHGAQSVQFASADVASMRLFHRVKKMQGLKKPRTG